MDFFEEAAEVVGIMVAQLGGDFADGLVRLIEEVTGLPDLELQEVGYGGLVGDLFEFFAVVGD